MDTLTHALSGALLARATAPEKTDVNALPLGRRVFLGLVAAALPDIDILMGQLGSVTYLLHHRGVTHSLILLPIWAFVLAWLSSIIWRRDRAWHAYFGVFAMGIGIHIAGDWITSFGTMVFAPLSDMRVGIGTTFIIDLWFTAIILAGLLASLIWRSSRAPAVAGLAALCGYVAYQGVLQERAIEWGVAYARGAGLEGAVVTAQPRPVSPYNWMVVVRHGDAVHYSLVNLVRRAPRNLNPDAGFIERLDAPYMPLTQAHWVYAAKFGSGSDQALAKEAWRHDALRFFRWFAAYPVLYRVDAGNPSTCVWFQDLRFFTPGRGRWPFRFGLCREHGGSWEPYQLVDDRTRIPAR